MLLLIRLHLEGPPAKCFLWLMTSSGLLVGLIPTWTEVHLNSARLYANHHLTPAGRWTLFAGGRSPILGHLAKFEHCAISEPMFTWAQVKKK